MGIYTDLVTNARTFDPNGKLAQRLEDLAAKVDPDLPAAFGAADAVHTIAQYAVNPAAGTFTITITLASGLKFTTAGIAYNANAATIEGAIDTAATAAGVPDWTNGDITVAAETTDLTDGDITLTFDGTSVAGANHHITQIDDTGLFINGAGITEQTAGDTASVSEVQRLSTFANDPTGGTFRLSFSLSGDGPVTIAFNVLDIPFDVTAAELETLIDEAAVAAGYTTWSGEIQVTASATDLTDGTMDLTFGDGLLVAFADHDLATVDGSGLTGGLLDATPVAKTTEGQTDRIAWAVLKALDVITTTTPPSQREPVAPTAGANALGIKPWMIQEIAQEAAAEDQNNETYAVICDAVFGTEHRKSMLVQSVA